MIASFDDGATTVAANWLLTFAIHSTCILGLALALSHALRDRWIALQERLLRLSLWAAVVSTTLQLTCAPTALPLSLTSNDENVVAVAPAGTVFGIGADVGFDGDARHAGGPITLQPLAPMPHDAKVATDAGGAFRFAELSNWPLTTWLTVLAAIFGGAGALWLLRTHHRLRAILRRREPETDGRTLAAAASAAGAIGLRQSPHVSRSDEILTPIAFGLLRPEICLPRRASALPDDELRAMLAHEIAHLERRDPVWMWFAAGLQAAFPWQFLTVFVRRRWTHLVELRCDAVAAAQTSPTVVARCLLDVAEWLRPAKPIAPLALGMAARPSALRRRVDAALRRGAAGRFGRGWSIALSGLSLSALTFVAPGVQSAPADDGDGVADFRFFGVPVESGADRGAGSGDAGDRAPGAGDEAEAIAAGDAMSDSFAGRDPEPRNAPAPGEVELMIAAAMNQLETEHHVLEHELQRLRTRAAAAPPERRRLVTPLIAEIEQRLLIVDRSCERIRELLDRRAGR